MRILLAFLLLASSGLADEKSHPGGALDRWLNDAIVKPVPFAPPPITVPRQSTNSADYMNDPEVLRVVRLHWQLQAQQQSGQCYYDARGRLICPNTNQRRRR